MLFELGDIVNGIHHIVPVDYVVIERFISVVTIFTASIIFNYKKFKMPIYLYQLTQYDSECSLFIVV